MRFFAVAGYFLSFRQLKSVPYLAGGGDGRLPNNIYVFFTEFFPRLRKRLSPPGKVSGYGTGWKCIPRMDHANCISHRFSFMIHMIFWMKMLRPKRLVQEWRHSSAWAQKAHTAPRPFNVCQFRSVTACSRMKCIWTYFNVIRTSIAWPNAAVIWLWIFAVVFHIICQIMVC